MKMSNLTLHFISDYLQHAPCMRRVQAGYEQCADTYQIQIKMLNENAATQRQQNVAATALANGGGDNADGESAHPVATGMPSYMPISVWKMMVQ